MPFRTVLNLPLPPTPGGASSNSSPLPLGRSTSTSRGQRNAVIQRKQDSSPPPPPLPSTRPVPPNRGRSLDSGRSIPAGDNADLDSLYINRATLPISFKHPPQPLSAVTKPPPKATIAKEVTTPKNVTSEAGRTVVDIELQKKVF